MARFQILKSQNLLHLKQSNKLPKASQTGTLLERLSCTGHLNYLLVSDWPRNIIVMFHYGGALQTRKWAEVGERNLLKDSDIPPRSFYSSNIKTRMWGWLSKDFMPVFSQHPTHDSQWIWQSPLSFPPSPWDHEPRSHNSTTWGL